MAGSLMTAKPEELQYVAQQDGHMHLSMRLSTSHATLPFRRMFFTTSSS